MPRPWPANLRRDLSPGVSAVCDRLADARKGSARRRDPLGLFGPVARAPAGRRLDRGSAWRVGVAEPERSRVPDVLLVDAREEVGEPVLYGTTPWALAARLVRRRRPRGFRGNKGPRSRADGQTMVHEVHHEFPGRAAICHITRISNTPTWRSRPDTGAGSTTSRSSLPLNEGPTPMTAADPLLVPRRDLSLGAQPRARASARSTDACSLPCRWRR